MRNLLAYGVLALLVTAPVSVSAQTDATYHFSRADASGEVDPFLVAVAEQSNDLASQGEMFLKRGNYRDAEKLFRDALAVATSSATGLNPSASRGLAEAVAGEGRVAEAEQMYRTLIYQEPLKWSSVAQESRTTMSFAALLSRTGKWPEATAVYKAASDKASLRDVRGLDVQFDPQVPTPLLLQAVAHIAIGLEYVGHGDNSPAFAEFDKGMQLQPDAPLINYYYGTGWQRLTPAEKAKFGNAAQAKAALQKAAKLGEGDVKKNAEESLKAFAPPR